MGRNRRCPARRERLTFEQHRVGQKPSPKTVPERKSEKLHGEHMERRDLTEAETRDLENCDRELATVETAMSEAG